MESESNGKKMSMFNRAQTMKNRPPDEVRAIPNHNNIHHTNGNGATHKQPPTTDSTKVGDDTQVIHSLTKKYGLPFSFHNSHGKQGGVDAPAATTTDNKINGNLASVFAKRDTNASKDTAATLGNGGGVNGDVASARDRFRRAGMKARLARRMEKIAEDRMTIKQIFNRYVDNSTLHGFRFIFMDTYYVRRFLWLALTCSMACLFFMELEKSIKLFYQYPFTTLSTIEYVPELKFPAISLCMLNNYQVTKINKSKLKPLYDRGLFPFHGEPFSPGFDMSGEELLKTIKASSQDLDFIFKGCEWKSRDTAKTGKPNLCGSMNFTRYSNLEGQTCFTFNSGINTKALTLNETGLNMAFKLELDLHVKDSVQSLEEVGVNIIIHDQDETPLHHAGFIVSPGFQTFVEMKVKKVRWNEVVFLSPSNVCISFWKVSHEKKF